MNQKRKYEIVELRTLDGEVRRVRIYGKIDDYDIVSMTRLHVDPYFDGNDFTDHLFIERKFLYHSRASDGVRIFTEKRELI